MPITFNCPCGKTLRVPDEHAGRRAKCPACAAVVTVPAPEVEPVLEVVEDTPAPPTAAAPGAKPYSKPVDDDDSYDGTTYSLAPDKSKDDDDAPHSSPKKGLPNFRKGRDNHT
jgi:hypothetical protein